MNKYDCNITFVVFITLRLMWTTGVSLHIKIPYHILKMSLYCFDDAEDSSESFTVVNINY